MKFDLPSLLLAARGTVQQPRAGARGLLNLNLPPSVAWVGLVLMAVTSAGLSTLTFLLSTQSDAVPLDPAMLELFTNPLQLAALQAGVLLVSAALIAGLGRMFGGAGRFEDALLLVVWLEFILLLLQIVQTAVMLFSPTLAGALGLFGLVLFIWLLANFIAELHGFASILAVGLAIIGAVFAISLAAAVLIVAFTGVGG